MVRKSAGYWSIEQTVRESREFMEKNGLNHLPSRAVIERSKHIPLVGGIMRNGGLSKIRKLLGNMPLKLKKGRLFKYVNESYFDDPKDVSDLKREYYTLGLLFSCYTPTTNPGGIIFRSDREGLVEFIKDELESEHAIGSEREGGASHQIEIRNNHLRSALEKKGLVKDKSKRRFPKIEEVYLDHFIRGFFDSQANVGIIKSKRNQTRIWFNSPSFLSGLHSKLREHAKVKLGKLSGNFLRYGHADSIRIHDFIYRDWDFMKYEGSYLKSREEKFNTLHGVAVIGE